MGDLTDEFWRTASVLAFTQVGLEHLDREIPWVTSEENPDPALLLLTHHPDDPASRADGAWRRSELQGAAAPGGWLQQWLTDAWLALILARWEYHYRPAFAQQWEVPVDQVVSPVIGDLRLLRNDVIHHGGIATPNNTGRCRMLTRFAPEERIVLTPEDLRALTGLLHVGVDTYR